MSATMASPDGVPAGAPAASPGAEEAAVADETGVEVVMERCEQLAQHSASPEHLERVHLSPEHAAVNVLADRWMRRAGMSSWTDEAGNQCGRLEGPTPNAPALLLGSHLDTVRDAGKYDGMLGVVIAIAVAQRMAARAAVGQPLPFALEVVAFGDEEGTRFGAALLGSRALAGTWQESWWELADAAGVTLHEAALAFGLSPKRIGDAAREPGSLLGYLECHIEQGPHLETADKALGVVTSIAGARRFSCRVVGESRHAGGTPYARRRDALLGASSIVLLVERIAREAGVIATVGRLQAYPGGVNVVPGLVEFSVDIRAEHDADRDAAWRSIMDAADDSCARRGLTLQVEETHSAPGVYCAEWLQRAVAAGLTAAGDDAPMALYSRAGHDAMAVATLCDVAMLFVRCEDGISHNPGESVDKADVALAIDAMEAAVLDVARQWQDRSREHD